MLNRKTSNYIFYGTLILILAITLIIRTVVIGSLNSNVDSVTLKIRQTQAQIDNLKDTVQENKDVQVNHLYELYGKVPNLYNLEALVNYTYAQLEVVGVTDDNEILRNVSPNDQVTFDVDSEFYDIQKDFKVVEVQVYFNTLTIDLVDQFIDRLYESEQVFIVNSIEYYSPDGTNYIGVTVKFLAFYDVEEES